ncbi:MAG: long-chain fatty acid--CoA ligase [Candidatus Hodarchaeota archaeon]
MVDRKIFYQFWPEGVPKDVEIPDIPLFEMLRETAKKFPDAIATTYFGVQMTYKQLDDISDRIATKLVELGLNKGETVALHFTNIPPCPACYFGVLKAGGRVTMLSPLFKTLEVKYQLNDSEAKILIVWEGFETLDEPIIPETKVETVIYCNLGPWFEPDPAAPGDLLSPDGSKLWLEDIIKQTEPNPPSVDINPREDIACLQYTGGTTGLPKGAMLTHRNLVANVTQMVAVFPEAEFGKEVIMAALPFYHIYAQVVVLLLGTRLGANMVLISNPREAEELIDAAEQNRVTLFPGIAALFNNINNHEGVENRDMKSIKYCMSGAGPLPRDVQEKFEALTGAKLREGYGLTEASPMTHVNPLAGRFKLGTVGLPAPSTDVKIVDIETGEKELGLNEIGEICVKGPQVMKGYYKRPKETTDTIRDGWLYTGDAGFIDDEGYLHIKERLKNMIKYKGHSVYPAEVENLLYENEAILECAVIGVPDEVVGENIKAYIVLKKDYKGKVTAEEIIEWAKNNMGYDKYPRDVEFIEEIPKSRIGKILHRLLREGKTDIFD